MEVLGARTFRLSAFCEHPESAPAMSDDDSEVEITKETCFTGV